GFRNDRIDFFADSQTEKKLRTIRVELENSCIANKYEFMRLIDELDELRKERNIVVHSLVLTDMEDQNSHMFHSYQKIKGEILNKTTLYGTSDLEVLQKKICEIHNAFYNLHFK